MLKKIKQKIKDNRQLKHIQSRLNHLQQCERLGFTFRVEEVREQLLIERQQILNKNICPNCGWSSKKTYEGYFCNHCHNEF